MMRLAARIAINRTVAGVHFPIDSISGGLLGLTLGDYFLARIASGDNHYAPAHFDGTAADIGGCDFIWSELYDLDHRRVRFSTEAGSHPAVKKWGGSVHLSEPGSGPLAWLWNRAKGEWT